MAVTDQIADFITRIRNAGTAGHKEVLVAKSNIKYEIAKILMEQGFIEDVVATDEGYQGMLKITLKYHNKQSVIKEIKRISKPGRRVYTTSDNIPRVRNGLGICILSTSKGVLTAKNAAKVNAGGEVLCTVW